MADPDSCSMTPPLSPLMGLADAEMPAWVVSPPKKRREDTDPDVPVCFACIGEVLPTQGHNTHSQSYLQRGELERLLRKNDPLKSEETSITTELFGHHFVSELALDESMDTLFYLCRQQADKTADTCPMSSCGKTLLDYRHNIRRFFSYVKGFVIRYTSDDVVSTDSFLQRLLRHLQALILYFGHVHELPSHVTTTAASRLGNQSALPSYHLFHLHLDIRWSLIEIIHILSIKYPEACGSVRLYETDGDDLSDSELFSQLIRLTLWDLVKLALPMHAKMSVNDYRRQTPYSCGCVRELLILLVKLLQHRHIKLSKQSFWSSFYPVIQNLLAKLQPAHNTDQPMEADCSQFSLPPEYACPDPVGFCWWLLLHLARLYSYDDYGIYKDSALTDAGQNNYYAMQTLLKTMLANRLSEGHLRCYLRCCLGLCQLWGPNPDVVSLLWEHFYKRLNEHFRQSGLGIEGLASMCKTPSSWLEQCRERCLGDESKLDSDSSYNLFLRMIAVHLSAPPGGKVNNTWNRIKGRFYTKFHTRRMQELTEVGLVNFSSLFLTLAMATDTEDVVGRMCNLLASMGSLDVARRATAWRALFAAILLYIETSRDVGFLAEKLVQAFNTLCSELSVAGLESSRYSELSALISQYLDATQDVLEMSSSFGLSQHKLLGSGLKDILKVCRENELRNVLSFCQAVLSKLRMIEMRSGQLETSGQIQSTSDRMWSSVLTFVKSHACTQTPPAHVADVAASFTLLSITSPPSIETGMKEDFLGLFRYFGWNEQVNASISCRFLCHLLANQSAMERLRALLNNHETLLIAAWFRCCWQLPSDNDQLVELTRLVLRLDEVREMFQTTGTEMGGTSSAVQDFIIALGKKHSLMTELRQKLEYQARVKLLLGDVGKHISHALRPGSGEELRTAYLLGGLLARHCAHLLYVKSRPDCAFPVLLERLALPRILLTPNKPLPPQVLAAIRQNLSLYIQGISKLDFRRDPYIQRKLKEMVVQYLPRFPIKAAISMNVATVYPLVAALRESCVSVPSADAILFRQHILNVVCSEFVTIQRSTSQSNPQLGLGFVAEVFNKTKKPSVIASDGRILMTAVLDLVLQNDSQATAVLHQILAACTKEESRDSRADVSHAVEMMVTRHLVGQQARVMRTLELVSERCPSLLVPLIPALTGAVRATESKRGVGLDKQLRVTYFAVLANLGEEGQTEKSALLASSSR